MLVCLLSSLKVVIEIRHYNEEVMHEVFLTLKKICCAYTQVTLMWLSICDFLLSNFCV